MKIQTKLKHLSSIWIAVGTFLVSILLTGCFHDNFDSTLLPGYWQSGTLHEYYKADGTGYTWDTADDVTEEEAQAFTWTLQGATLTQYHQMTVGGVVPKTYTVTTLSASLLKYHDDYGTAYTFTK